MVLRKIAPNPTAQDPESRALLVEYEELGHAHTDRGFRELFRNEETRLARGDVRADLWLAKGEEPAGLAVWDLVPGVGRRVRIYLGPAHRSREDLAQLFDELGEQSGQEGPVASVVDHIPGVAREEQEKVFSVHGFFPVERLVLRLPPTTFIPDDSPAGTTDLRPIDASDEEALVGLMRDAYDQLAGEAAPWMFYRDPRQDARDAVHEILEGRRGEWLPWASFGIDIGGVLRGASLVTRLEVPILAEVMVAPSVRGIGLGYSLALGSVRALRERGHPVLDTTTTSYDLRALRLWRRVGFEPAEVATVGLWVSRTVVGVPAGRP
jgi:GNAT superfamily N-acetyltransferase